MFSTKSKRNFLSFKDICQNVYHIETTNKNDSEYLYITLVVSGGVGGELRTNNRKAPNI